MILYLYEKLAQLLGYRKSGIKEVSLGMPRAIQMKKIENKEVKYTKDFNLSGNTETAQGQTSACACATLCAYLEDYIIREMKDKSVGIRWLDMWEHMKEMGIASEEEGSYLQDNIWYMQNIGVKDNKGRAWVIDGMERIPKMNIEDMLRSGYEIYTGAMVGMPMVDKDYLYKTGVGKYGHAFRLTGIENGYILAETTWSQFGLRKESQFFMNKKGIEELFSCYILTFKNV